MSTNEIITGKPKPYKPDEIKHVKLIYDWRSKTQTQILSILEGETKYLSSKYPEYKVKAFSNPEKRPFGVLCYVITLVKKSHPHAKHIL